MRQGNVCFAYYADGKFIGWYADTFGSVRSCPKVYPYTDSQVEVIAANFNSKLKKVNTSSFDQAKAELDEKKQKGLAGLLGAVGLALFDSEDLLRGKLVELRFVKCPFYDGQDPENPRKWIHADYGEVKKWASKEPTEFSETLFYNGKQST